MKTRVVNRRRERFDVYIGRPGPFGNPFSHMPGTLARFRVATRDEAVARFREWFLSQPALVERARRELKGKVLGCWCKPALLPRRCYRRDHRRGAEHWRSRCVNGNLRAYAGRRGAEMIQGCSRFPRAEMLLGVRAEGFLDRPLDVLPFRTFARLRLGFALEPLDAP